MHDEAAFDDALTFGKLLHQISYDWDIKLSLIVCYIYWLNLDSALFHGCVSSA